MLLPNLIVTTFAKKMSKADTASTPGVELYQVELSYGWGRFKTPILKGINLNVAAGTIYGLLGPSGCGKTTLLKCIVGRLKPSKGYVQVFGEPPGTKKSGIPGQCVGYMPQELAIIQELTIRETLTFFGRLYSMSQSKIKSRTDFLLDFLNLPTQRRLVKNLSGGQQRRVSFAIALLHEPPLVILDEPTVGVDPLLRISIWDHLIDISKNDKITVIVTTHYIEEARQANRVGLMRFGKILAEDEPGKLVSKSKLGNLEDVFLKLCQQDSQKQIDEPPPEPTPEEQEKLKAAKSKTPICVIRLPSVSRIFALIIKNFIKMLRTLLLLSFEFINPAIQITLFCLAIGGDPRSLDVAIFNEDTGKLGLQFLNHLSTDGIHQVQVKSVKEGTDLVLSGDAWAIIYMEKNFSTAVMQRFMSTSVSKEVIKSATVHVRDDRTDQQVAFFLHRTIMDAFNKFAADTLKKSGQNPALVASPIEFGEPIYGSKDSTFTDYMAPGVILSIAYFLAVGLTSLSFVLDKKEGLLDRSYVSGVTSFEIMCGHIITEMGVMAIQVAILLILAILAFGVTQKGSIFWVILLCLLQGTCGMTYGFLISTVCNEERSAIMLALGSFYPCLLLSGILWPIESMPHWLQIISHVLPQTIPIEAMRWLMARAKGITFLGVYAGFLVTLAWIFVFVVLSGIVLKFKG